MRTRTDSGRTGAHHRLEWRGSARRYRRLQIVQLAILAAFGVLSVAATMSVSTLTGKLRTAQEREARTLATLDGLTAELSAQHVAVWRDGTTTGRVTMPASARAFAAAGPLALRAITQDGSFSTPTIERIGQESQVIAERLAAQVLAFPDGGLSDTDGRTRDALKALDDDVKQLTALARKWIKEEQAILTEQTRHADRATRRALLGLTIVLALLALATGGIVWRLDRSRRRLVGSLEDAADRLRLQAETDQLTGLPGHAAFHARLRSAFDAAAAEGEPLALVVLDLDHFKEINDAFGHPVGDQVLRAVAQELAVTARPDDVVARVGGEEFAWLMSRADCDRAFDATERLRTSIEGASIGPVRTVTISAGVCDTNSADSPGELFRLADGALYWAKNHGRNLTARYAPHIIEELSEEERAARLERLMVIKTVRALARAVDAKDPNTRRHSERVGEVAQAIAAELGWDTASCADLYDAALVHDVGKIGVPDAVLFKEGRLSDEEREQMRQHPLLGARMLAGVLSGPQVSWVRGHHERLDGQGYPDGLAGEDIPVGARILALADSWDAMTSRRSYSEPRSIVEALAECHACCDTQFCPDAVGALVRLVAEDRLPGIVAGDAVPTAVDELLV